MEVVNWRVNVDGCEGILGSDLKLPSLEKQERDLVKKSEGEIVLPKSELATSAGKLTGTVLS